ncbi:MAG: hypothetical protein CMK59_14590 [Proteobacteria bacterium]|nr:hypothetical protein [Pseudomonadota bacterium]
MFRLLLTGIAVQLLLSPAVFAQKKETRRVLRSSELAQEDIAAKYNEAAHQENLNAIKQYEEFLKSAEMEGDQKAELMFRLAEKYFEEGKFEYNIEMEAYQKTYDDCFNTPGCDVTTMEADHEKSRKWQKKAIRLYTTVLSSYPQYPRADEVLWFLGSAYAETKQPDKAVRQFVRLTQSYTDSRYIADAYVSIGEYYFDRNNAFKALKAYKQATRFQNSEQYGFALYKLAWCYYNVQEYGEAIEHMKQVVTFSSSGSEANSKKRITLQEEALKDLVRFFADAGEMEEAEDYFNKLGREELVMNMLKRLAGMYFEQGKFEESVKTYRRLISKDPNSVKNPGYQNEIIQSYRRMGRKQDAIDEVGRLLKDYGKQSAWAQSNSSNPDAVKKAADHIERALYDVATSYHNEARKLGTGRQAEETYRLAESAYRTYITELPNGKNAYVMRNNFAEILYDLKKYDEAYVQYMAVVAADPQGQHSLNGADSAIICAYKMKEKEAKEGKIQKRKSDTDIEPLELSEWETKLLESLDNFGKIYPNHKDAIQYLTESADLLFEKNRLDEASERFRQVIAMNPKSKQAMRAAIQITEALAFRAKSKATSEDFKQAVSDYKALKETSKAFYDQKGLGNSKFKKDMFEYYQLAYLQLIDMTFKSSPGFALYNTEGSDLKDNNDVRAAANGFRDYVDAFPEAENAPNVLNTSAVYYYKIKDMAKTMETRHLMIDKYPTSKYYIDHIAELGYAYETIADFETASQWYEKLFEIDKEHASAKDAFYTASLFRESLGQWEQAIANKEKYIQAYPEDERVLGMKIDIPKVYQKFDQIDKAKSAYNNFQKNPPKDAPIEFVFFARMKYGEILRDENRPDRLDKHWDMVLKQFEKLDEEKMTPQMKVFKAEAAFERAIYSSQKYMDSKISGPSSSSASQKSIDRALKKQLKVKTEGLQKTEEKYNEVIAIGGGEWTLAAVVQIGRAYDNYAQTIQNSYIPTYLSEDQKELYNMQLEDRTYQYQQKAIAYYQKALEVAFELNLYNETTAFATRRLGELRPEEYQPLTEDLLDPNYLSTQIRSRTFFETLE